MRSRSRFSIGTNLRQNPTWNGSPAEATMAAASRAWDAVMPTGFSHSVGIPAETSRLTVSRWRSLGTHTSTASRPSKR